MQFVDLSAQQKRIRKKLENNIHAVLDHGKYIMGPEIKTLDFTTEFKITSDGIVIEKP
ncbi:MAG: hypothetical protein HKO68_06915, partial [Desulfobacterales bacterium]|nr:hypothetical protein [Desulfobacterales bacterium]